MHALEDMSETGSEYSESEAGASRDDRGDSRSSARSESTAGSARTESRGSASEGDTASESEGESPSEDEGDDFDSGGSRGSGRSRSR